MNAWALARTLDPLPRRLAFDLGPDDAGVVAAIVGAVWCVSLATADQAGSWRALGQRMAEGLAEGTELPRRVVELADEAVPGAGPVARDTYLAWQEARRAVDELRAAVAWPDQPDADRWLAWLHGRNTKGRTHHYSQLLLALTARPTCLWSASTLAQRLFERPSAPHDLDTVLSVQLNREELRVGDEPVAQDVRGLPLARFLAAWLLLEGKATRASAAHWLTEIADDVRKVAPTVWSGGLPVQRSLDADASAPTWITREITRRRKSDEDPPGTEAPLQPRERVGAALAFALNQTADNFAVRVMPTLALWRAFWEEVRAWMDAHPEVAPPGGAEPWLWTWELRAADGTPWSASRLFLHLSRALVDERPVALIARSLDRAHLPGRAALLALVDELVDSLGQTSVAARARSREAGLRWQDVPLTDHPVLSSRPAG